MQGNGGQTALTDEQAALYDRQIRLWGVEAQQRIGQAKVLFYGFTSVASEICKNLVLAGIQSVTINDKGTCTLEKTAAHLFLDPTTTPGQNLAEASVPRIQILNPHVKVSATQQNLDEIDLSQFDLCCFSGLSFQEHVSANLKTRKAKTSFFATETFGYFGYSFQDLLDFAYEKENAKHTKQFCTLEAALQTKTTKTTNAIFLWIKCLQIFYSQENRKPVDGNQTDFDNLTKIATTILQQSEIGPRDSKKFQELLPALVRSQGTEFSPVCAIVGGVVAQEILKVVCHNDEPFSNFFFFNGIDDTGVVQAMTS